MADHTYTMYNRELHDEMLREWCLAHEVEDATKLVPPIGVIVDGVFGVWLIRTDCGLAFVDFFIGKPGLPKETIKEALAAGCVFCGDLARAMGFKRVFAMVDRQSTAQLCIDHGFVEREKIRVFMRSDT